MPKILDIQVTDDELALFIGRMQIQILQLAKKASVLEKRVDELDPLPEVEVKVKDADIQP